MLPDGLKYGECSIFNPSFIDFEETSSYWSAQFVHFFLCFPLGIIIRQATYDLGILRQESTESKEVSMVTISRQTSNDPRYPPLRLRHHTRFADGSYEVCRLGHLYRNGRIRAGLNTALDKTVRAVLSYNSWL